MLIIGITGGTGSGKTTVVRQVMGQLHVGSTCVISQDSYYHDTTGMSLEEREKINFDHPDAIDFKLLAKHLRQLKAGQNIEQPVYSFLTHNRTGDVLLTSPCSVIIVEGILILANPEVRKLLDIKIFVDAAPDERLIRRLKRDIEERGRSMEEVLWRYQTALKPMHEQFIEPTKAYADIILPHNNYNSVAVSLLKSIIDHNIKS